MFHTNKPFPKSFSRTLLSTLLAGGFSAVTAEEAKVLAPVEINATAETPYVVKRSTSATKTESDLLETPMAVQVIPLEVIEDRQLQNTLEAAKTVSGVQAQPGTFYDHLQIRGFGNGGKNFRNGLGLEGITNSVNMAFVDRVEVVKGPASMLYGRIEPGGFVNVVTKKPQEEAAISLQQQFGSWGMQRTTGDATGALNEERTLLYRVIGVYDKGDSWVRFDHHESKALAAALTFRPSTAFEFNLNLEHYNTRQTSPDGTGVIPVIGNRLANLPRSFSASEATMWRDFPYTLERNLIGFDWTYKFNNDWKLTHRFHYTHVDETQTAIGLWNGTNGVDTFVNRTFVYNPVERDIYGTNLDLQGEVTTGSVRHKLLFGADWYTYSEKFGGYVGPSPLPDLNIFNPVYGNFDPAVLRALVNQSASNKVWKYNSPSTGIYAQDQIAFDEHWHLLLGGRYDVATTRMSTVYGAAPSACYPNCTAEPMVHYTDSAFSPRVGLLYKLNNSASVYGSYSQSFGSNNGISATGSRFDPEKGTQYELGAKSALLNGKLLASATLFDLRKSNILTPDLANPGASIAVGEVRSRGLELDLSGQLSKHVSVMGSYTYDDAVVTKDNGGVQGKHYRGVAPHAFSLWSKYDFAPGAREGWSLGAGLLALDDRWGDNTNTWKLPAYVKVDALAAYRTMLAGKTFSFQLNVKNLFDKKYFEASDGGTNAYYGAPRTIIAGVKVDL